MNIGIICLANGPYSIFIDNLINSCEEKFLPNYRKEYFIITDSEDNYTIRANSHTILKPRNGWPLDCLLRPRYSYELLSKTSHLDYVYFFNANIHIYTEVGEEVLPGSEGLVGVEHPYYTHRQNKLFSYDRNPLSRAYIPLGQGSVYYQACLWGGTYKAFMEFSQAVQSWVDEDINNGIEPVWLDESYLNKYFFLNPPKTLPSKFAFPSEIPLFADSPQPKIIQLQKKDYIFDDNFRFI